MNNACFDLAAVVGLSNMLGLVSTDLVFDGSVSLAHSYYCPLLPTFRDARVVRMFGLVFAGAGAGAGLLYRRAAGDILAAVLLAGVGALAFYSTMGRGSALCSSWPYYEGVMGVARGATAAQLKREFRRRSLRACPYKVCDRWALSQLNEAYDALSDPGEDWRADTEAEHQLLAEMFRWHVCIAAVLFSSLAIKTSQLLHAFGAARPSSQKGA